MNDWKDLNVAGDNSVRYIASFVLFENSFAFTLTDGIDTYEERLESKKIFERCSILNPAVDYTILEDLFRDLKELVFDKSTCVEVEKGQHLLRLDVTGKIDKIMALHWAFDLSKDNSGGLVNELLKATSRLLVENEHMKKTLKAKDLHILDLEGSGATLSRKSLKTKPFDSECDLKKIPNAADRSLDVLVKPQYRELHERISINSQPAAKDALIDNDRTKQVNKKGLKRGDLFHDDIEDDAIPHCIEPPVKRRLAQGDGEAPSSSEIEANTVTVGPGVGQKKKNMAAKKLRKL